MPSVLFFNFFKPFSTAKKILLPLFLFSSHLSPYKSSLSSLHNSSLPRAGGFHLVSASCASHNKTTTQHVPLLCHCAPHTRNKSMWLSTIHIKAQNNTSRGFNRFNVPKIQFCRLCENLIMVKGLAAPVLWLHS